MTKRHPFATALIVLSGVTIVAMLVIYVTIWLGVNVPWAGFGN